MILCFHFIANAQAGSTCPGGIMQFLWIIPSYTFTYIRVYNDIYDYYEEEQGSVMYMIGLCVRSLYLCVWAKFYVGNMIFHCII